MSRRTRIIFIDSFSGAAADLPPKQRTPEHVLAVLRKHPRISCFDFSEHLWLYKITNALLKSGAITEDKSELYPWHRFHVVEPTTKKTRRKRNDTAL